MQSHIELNSLVDRSLCGDVDAARTLVEIYEPTIQAMARKSLARARLKRIVDVADISQSVFEHFFRCAQKNAFRALSHKKLLGFLKTITRNVVIDEHRKHNSQKRGGQLLKVTDLFSLQADEHDPSTLCEIRDFSNFIRSLLSASELDIADLRLQGYSWSEVSEKTGSPQDCVRKKLHRAFARVRRDPAFVYSTGPVVARSPVMKRMLFEN